MKLDSVASTFAFVARFNPDNEDHKLLFKPLSYHAIEIFKSDNTLLLTGTILIHEFNSNDAPELVKISGYSKCGILEDVNIPYSAYPLESNNRTLKEISERLFNLFSIKLIVDASVLNDVNLVYGKSIAEPTDSIKTYIAKLTAQRNILMSHNSKGNIVFFRPNTAKASSLFLNAENCTNMAFTTKGQSFHSEISILRQPSSDGKNLTPVDTIKNQLINSFRPKVKTLSSGTDTDTSKASQNELASELQNVELVITLPRVEELKPGDIVDVQNKEIYLYERTKFMINSIVINENESKTNMVLNLTLPEAFTGKQPKNIFHDNT